MQQYFNPDDPGVYAWLIGCTRDTNRKKRTQFSCQPRPVVQFDMDGKEISRFKSLTEASQKSSVTKANLCKHLAGISRTCGGSVWKYTSDL